LHSFCSLHSVHSTAQHSKQRLVQGHFMKSVILHNFTTRYKTCNRVQTPNR